MFRIEDLAVMGLTEVLSSLPRIFSIMRRLVKYVNVWKPDLIITIDSPDFSTRFVKRVRKVDKFVPTIHYVAPSVWAWRPSRAKEMAKYYDQVLALLPFEVDCFRKVGLNCEFVGHPVVSEEMPSQEEIRSFIIVYISSFKYNQTIGSKYFPSIIINYFFLFEKRRFIF